MADDVLNRVESCGAKVTQGKMPVPGMGWSAYVLDSEGNTTGLFQQHQRSRRPGLTTVYVPGRRSRTAEVAHFVVEQPVAPAGLPIGPR